MIALVAALLILMMALNMVFTIRYIDKPYRITKNIAAATALVDMLVIAGIYFLAVV